MPFGQRNRAVSDGEPDADRALRILVADDEESIRTIVGYALSHQGWDVTSVEEGSDVASVLAACQQSQEPFDLAILDLEMSRMGSKETYERLRDCYPDLPILFMSGWPRETVWRDMENTSAEFVAKPFSIKSLVAKVQRLLSPRSAA